jgi:ADP-ribosylation factor 6
MGSYLFRKPQVKTLLLGLDNAGKTTFLYKIKATDYQSNIPSIVYNPETAKHQEFSIMGWDLGEEERLAKRWKIFYEGTQAIIFMIDSRDHERINLVKEELWKIHFE